MTTSLPSTPQIDTLKAKENTNSPLRSQSTILPMGRVKTIMKSSPDVDQISNESLFLITKATEVFIMYMTKLSQRYGNDQELTYEDLATIVGKKDSMEFLQDIVPKKITYAEYLSIMEKEFFLF